MIELYLLEQLVAFYEEGSISKAGEKLFVSQSAISRGMQKIESLLGISLFERSKNNVSFNENGKKMVEYAKNILDTEKAMTAKAKEIKDNENVIRVGMTAPGILFLYADKFLLGGTNQYQRTIAGEKELYRGLEHNLYDIIFVNEEPKTELPHRFIIEEQLYLSVPKTHFLSGMDKVTYEDVDGQSFLLSNQLGIWDDIVQRRLPKSRFLIQEMQHLSEVVEGSHIPSFATNITKSASTVADRVCIPFVGEDSSIRFYAVARKEEVLSLF